MNPKPILITVLIWLASTIIFAAIGFRVLDWQKWHDLARHGIETSGQVVGKEPKNHEFIRYSYDVGQQAYSGLGSAGRGNPEFEQLKIGDVIKVFYDPGNPEVSIPGDRESQARSSTAGVLFLAIAGPLFLMIGLYAKGWLPISMLA
jgi:hypothetical protein